MRRRARVLEIAQCSRTSEHQRRTLGALLLLIIRKRPRVWAVVSGPLFLTGLVLLRLNRLAFPASSHFRRAARFDLPRT